MAKQLIDEEEDTESVASVTVEDHPMDEDAPTQVNGVVHAG